MRSILSELHFAEFSVSTKGQWRSRNRQFHKVLVYISCGLLYDLSTSWKETDNVKKKCIVFDVYVTVISNMAHITSVQCPKHICISITASYMERDLNIQAIIYFVIIGLIASLVCSAFVLNS